MDLEAERDKYPQYYEVELDKSNILLVGSTGTGKTLLAQTLARILDVPFTMADATTLTEAGYVGEDVENIILRLLQAADFDVTRAEHGIIYIDEIDKIASSRGLVGADVSRTGVQRALLKPLEETEVELKVPHDPISMMQEMKIEYLAPAKANQRENISLA